MKAFLQKLLCAIFGHPHIIKDNGYDFICARCGSEERRESYNSVIIGHSLCCSCAAFYEKLARHEKILTPMEYKKED